MSAETHHGEDNLNNTLHTYHCMCNTLLLASVFPLTDLPLRKCPARDRAYALPLSMPERRHPKTTSQDAFEQKIAWFSNAATDTKVIVVRREDGFEKRTLIRCGRCNLIVGYRLDPSRFTDQTVMAENIAYILPGALVSTTDMSAGRKPSDPGWMADDI